VKDNIAGLFEVMFSVALYIFLVCAAHYRNKWTVNILQNHWVSHASGPSITITYPNSSLTDETYRYELGLRRTELGIQFAVIAA